MFVFTPIYFIGCSCFICVIYIDLRIHTGVHVQHDYHMMKLLMLISKSRHLTVLRRVPLLEQELLTYRNI